MDTMESSMRSVNSCMLSNKLKLNSDKTELLELSARQRPKPPLCHILVSGDLINPSNCVILGRYLMSSSYNWYLINKSLPFANLLFITLEIFLASETEFLFIESTKSIVNALVSSKTH